MTPADDGAAVLVAVDGGAHGWDALAWAAAEAAAAGRPLRIVYVVEWPVLSDMFIPMLLPDRTAVTRAAGNRVLGEAERRARDVDPNLVIVIRVEPDAHPAAAILRAGRTDSLIVVGRRRNGHALGSRFGWSVGSYLAKRAVCPVVIVRLADDGAGPSAGRIAVMVDDDADPFDALMFAFRAADRRGIGVTVLRTESRATARRLDRAQLVDAYTDAFAHTDVRQEVLGAARGPALAAASAGAALVVLGARAARHVHRSCLAPPARTLADVSRSPVLIVRSVTAPSNRRPDRSGVG